MCGSSSPHPRGPPPASLQRSSNSLPPVRYLSKASGKCQPSAWITRCPAAHVAVGMVPLALGTEAQGSVVRPASFCGAAFRPTFGLLPPVGALVFAPILDHVGTFAATSADINFAWRSLEFKSHGEPAGAVMIVDWPPRLLLQGCLRCREPALGIDTAPTWVVEPYRGRISAISRAFDCRYDGSREPSDSSKRLQRYWDGVQLTQVVSGMARFGRNFTIKVA